MLLKTPIFLTNFLQNIHPCLKDRGNGLTFHIDGPKCKQVFVDNYELELKRIEKSTKVKEVNLPNIPSTVTISKVTNNTNKVNEVGTGDKQEEQNNPIAEKFSLDVLDMERNKSIAGFKNMFQQLDQFKKSVLSSSSTNSSLDLDFLWLIYKNLFPIDII